MSTGNCASLNQQSCAHLPFTSVQGHAPIAGLEYKHGIKGTQGNQRDSYSEKIESISDTVYERLNP